MSVCVMNIIVINKVCLCVGVEWEGGLFSCRRVGYSAAGVLLVSIVHVINKECVCRGMGE